MDILQAISILSVEKGIAEMELEMYPENQHLKDFVNAVECLIDFVDEEVLRLWIIGDMVTIMLKVFMRLCL